MKAGLVVCSLIYSPKSFLTRLRMLSFSGSAIRYAIEMYFTHRMDDPLRVSLAQLGMLVCKHRLVAESVQQSRL